MRRTLSWIAVGIALTGCSSGSSSSNNPASTDKSGVVSAEGTIDTPAWDALCKLQGQPSGCDLCAALGWYGDGVCDTFCPNPDPDCSGSTAQPYGGTPWPIPGTIEAENYDLGGEGVAYHDDDATNTLGAYRNDGVDIKACTDTVGCGDAVGTFATGEWLQYTVSVAQDGDYGFSARVATIAAVTFHVEVDGTNASGAINVPANEANWDGGWETVTAPALHLSGGGHALRIVNDTGYFDINDFTFAANGNCTPNCSGKQCGGDGCGGSCGTCTGDGGNPQPLGVAPPVGMTWSSTFDDEFDTLSASPTFGDGLNWYNGGAWADGQTGVRYPSVGYPPAWDDPSEVYLDGQGNVALRTQYHPDGVDWSQIPNASSSDGSRNYTVGTLISKTFNQLYGYFECRMKVASTYGEDGYNWWLYNSLPGGSNSDEIDIAEFPGGYGATAAGAPGHFYDSQDHGSGGGGGWGANHIGDWTADFHVYAVDYEPDHIDFYRDGVLTDHTTDVITSPMFLLLDNEICSDSGGWCGDSSMAALPITTYVDYVRVWQLVPSP